MVDLPNLILSTLKGLAIGLMLLLASLFILPSSWVIWVLKYFKPSILKNIFAKNDKYFSDILGIILEGKYPGNYVDDELAQNKLSKVKELKDDLEKVESNMFTIDLLVDLFKTLSFALSRSGISSIGETYEEIANYFGNYSNRLFDTSYRHNFAEDVLEKFQQVSENIEKLDKDISIEEYKGLNSKILMQYTTSDFSSFLTEEQKSLEKNRSLIIGAIKSNVYELMELSK
jgi:hypothetical protein